MKYFRYLAMMLLAAAMAFTSCDGGGDDGGNVDGGGGATVVNFLSAEQTGGASGTADSTGLTLTFDVDPATLTADNIIVTGATEGALSGSGTTRSIAISDITVANGATVGVTITSPSGYAIYGSQTAVVYMQHSLVVFDKGSGTGGTDSVTAAIFCAMPTATAPTPRVGFEFLGYWDAPVGGTQYYNLNMTGMRNWDKTQKVPVTVLYARWNWAVYELGDTGPAGGVIFYINPNANMNNLNSRMNGLDNDWKYLECAPQSTEWTAKFWSTTQRFVGTLPEIGKGKSNTLWIVDKLNEEPAESDTAAQVCDALTYGGFDDWFLPSKDELNLMYTNLKVAGLGDFPAVGAAWYWSSSEYENSAWHMEFCDEFHNGSQCCGDKNYANRIRAIRAF